MNDATIELSNKMLTYSLVLDIDAGKVENASNPDYWDIDTEQLRVRYLHAPSFSVGGDERVRIVSPRVSFQVEIWKEIGQKEIVSGYARMTLTMGLELVVDDEEQVFFEMQDAELGFFDIEFTEGEAGENQLSKLRIPNQTIGEPLDLSNLEDIPPEHLRLSLSEGYLLITGNREAPPEDLSPLPSTHDLIFGGSCSLIEPLLQEEVERAVQEEPPTQLNTNYKLQIKTLNISLEEGGMRFTGSARAVGEPVQWYELADWFPDYDIEIKNLFLLFESVKEPDGKLVFTQTQVDIDIGAWNILKFFFTGLGTFGLSWGSRRLWWFLLPLKGLVAALVQFFLPIYQLKKSSAFEVSPRLGASEGEATDLSAQIKDIEFREEGVVLHADVALDDYYQGWEIQVTGYIRGAEQELPVNLPVTTKATLIPPAHLWWEDEGFWVSWTVDGNTIEEGRLSEHLEVEIGPYNSGDLEREYIEIRAVITRQYGEGSREVVNKSTYRRVYITGEMGEEEDCFLYSDFSPESVEKWRESYEERRKVHYGSYEKRCYHFTLATLSGMRHKAWGLPPAGKGFTTCKDCFGEIVAVDENREALLAEAQAWEEKR